jgi:hypothetical protein
MSCSNYYSIFRHVLHAVDTLHMNTLDRGSPCFKFALLPNDRVNHESIASRKHQIPLNILLQGKGFNIERCKQKRYNQLRHFTATRFDSEDPCKKMILKGTVDRSCIYIRKTQVLLIIVNSF